MSRIAIVTGGGTGIGRATALALNRDGCKVVISGRRPEPLAETQAAIGEADCLTLPGDIREPEVADALIDLALEAHGRIDVLVNNAGGQFTAPAEEITPNGWAAVRRLNLDAPWYLTQQVAIRSMIPEPRRPHCLRRALPDARHPGHGALVRRALRARRPSPACCPSSGAGSTSASSAWPRGGSPPRG